MGNLMNGMVLVVDLDSQKIFREDIDETFFKQHIGGAAANLALYERYSGDDPLVLGTGLLTGTPVPGSSLTVITARSPVTGKICHAPVCIYGGMELKYAGFDFVVLKGRSSNPVYIWLHDEVADINDAAHIWGKDTWAATDALRKSLGEDIIQVLCIGPAGEKQLDSAQIILNYWGTGDQWAFGKVFGQKNIKAIAMRGMGIFDIEDKEGFINACLEFIGEFKNHTALSGKKGITEISRAMGKDITEWLSPLIHRHSADFNCPYPMYTFVKYNESPDIMEETGVAEPGFYVTDIHALLGLKDIGLTSEQSCRILETCARHGINATAAAIYLGRAGKTSPEEIEKELLNFKGPIEIPKDSLFSPWSPKQPLFADFGLIADGSGNLQWWIRRQALAYIFGIHPIFILMAPMLTEERLLNAVNLGTGFDITLDMLESAIEKICE